LSTQPLSADARFSVQALLWQPDFHGVQLAVVDKELAVEALTDPVVARLMTMPAASVAQQGCARVYVLRQQRLPRSARWLEVVSPAWSFWRWILWAGDLRGLV
jgi:hypothetical protein